MKKVYVKPEPVCLDMFAEEGVMLGISDDKADEELSRKRENGISETGIWQESK